jgi:hypothetical protein
MVSVLLAQDDSDRDDFGTEKYPRGYLPELCAAHYPPGEGHFPSWLQEIAKVNFNGSHWQARWRTKRRDRWLSRFRQGRDRPFSTASEWTELPENWLATWKQ